MSRKVYLDNIEDINIYSGQYQVNCPECIKRVGKEDKGYKLGINFDINKFNCFRCGYKGVAESLIKRGNVHPQTLLNNALNMFFNKKKSRVNEARLELVDLENISKPIRKYHFHAINYLKDRNVFWNDIIKYDIRLGRREFKSFRNRILIPTFDFNNNCVYVVGRDYMDKSKIKYTNPTDTHKTYAVWNVNNLREDKTGIITEGVFDGIAADKLGHNFVGLSIFGKDISPTQAKLISRRDPKCLILSFDGEVNEKLINKNYNTIKMFYKKKVYIARLPEEHDPNSLDNQTYREIIAKSMCNKLSINIERTV